MLLQSCYFAKVYSGGGQSRLKFPELERDQRKKDQRKKDQRKKDQRFTEFKVKRGNHMVADHLA